MSVQPEKNAAWNTRLLHNLRELDFLPGEPRESVTGRAKGDVLFALSGMCYFFLYYRSGSGNTIAWYAMVLALFFLGLVDPGFPQGICLPRVGKLLALLNAVGTMGAGVRVSIDYLSGSYGTLQVAGFVGLSPKLVAAGISAGFGLCALWFLYVCIARLYAALMPVFSRLFAGTGRCERGALGLLVLALAVFSAAAFSASEAFYATAHNYDVLYTADSPYLLKGNTWLNLTFAENDLRQPLFAVFAAPFMGGVYALAQLLPSGSWLNPWLLNLPQLGLLVLSFYMLSALLAAKAGAPRLAITVSLCALYPSLLFSLMMEQYIVAVFWLLLFVYMAVEELPGRGGVLVAAAGSLLTSAAMLPALWRWDKPRPVRRALLQSLAAAGLGAFLILVCFRLDVVLNLATSVENLSSYTGGNISLMGRMRQYIGFAAGCFEPPLAEETMALGYPSWQLLRAEGIRPDGVAVLCLCALGAFWGRRERLVQISAWWCLFSVLLLVGMGWGTAENGLILYGLYFSWAFYVLVRRAIVQPGRWQTAADWLLALFLLVLNVPGMAALLGFAVNSYPV